MTPDPAVKRLPNVHITINVFNGASGDPPDPNMFERNAAGPPDDDVPVWEGDDLDSLDALHLDDPDHWDRDEAPRQDEIDAAAAEIALARRVEQRKIEDQDIEAAIKRHPGEHTLDSIAHIVYGTTQEEFRKEFGTHDYNDESRPADAKARHRKREALRKVFRGAVALLQHEGWIVQQQKGRQLRILLLPNSHDASNLFEYTGPHLDNSCDCGGPDA